MPPMNRRTFISTTVAASTAAALSTKTSWAAEMTHKIDKVGLQLYTVRDAMKTDFEGTIAKVASTGYKEVEFAGFFDHSPKDVRAILDKNGLKSPSMHVPYADVESKWPETLEAAHVVGQSYIVCPWLDVSQRTAPDGWQKAAALFNKAGAEAKKAGIQFGYHNHSFEFEKYPAIGDKMAYDYLLAELDPKNVIMELDLCWITVAGKDPVEYFKKYPGRFQLVHVKDYVNDPNSTSSFSGATGPSVQFKGHLADVGQGAIDWKRILAHSDEAGIKYYFVENDDAKDQFNDIKISYNYLHDLRF
jgi:sugar phosphate isomerase/epimerase